MKVDLLQLLVRRRVTVSRWLDENNIATLVQFEAWKVGNSDQYIFTDRLNAAVQEVLDSRVPAIEAFYTQEAVDELTQILDSEFQKTEKRPSEIVNVTGPKDMVIEEEEPKKKKNKASKAVHTSETEE